MKPVIPLFIQNKAAGVAVAEAHPEKTQSLIKAGRKKLSPPLLSLFDRLSKKWSKRTNNPHHEEISAIAKVFPKGIWFMNFCYEWGCTTAVLNSPDKPARLLRTLDWPFDGVGENVIVTKIKPENLSDYYSVTWPGFVGVLTAMAPDRFSAAINQAPIIKKTGLKPLDWFFARQKMWRQTALPPTHLLRQAFDECATYTEAKELLATMPIAVPVFFSLCGTDPTECCIIERTENDAHILEGPNVTANHWQKISPQGHPRPIDSFGRLAALKETAPGATVAFDWLRPPVLNKFTRLAVEADAASNTLIVIGYEEDGPATQRFDLANL